MNTEARCNQGNAMQEEFGGHLFERGRVFERDPETQSPILPSPLQVIAADRCR